MSLSARPRKQRLYPSKRQLIYLYDLLRELVDRNLKLLYKRSVLGIAWTLIAPLLQLAVFVLVFQWILSIDVPRYSSFVFSGLLVWTWFQSSLFQATSAIVSNRPLIRQPGFPISILPVAIVMTGLIHFLLALPVLLTFLAIDGVVLKPIILVLPLLMALQFGMTVCCAYILAALNVTFRDTQHTLGVVLQLLFYVTGIFYQIDNVPAGYQSLYYLNPMVHIITAYRTILIKGVQPDWFPLLVLSLLTAAFLPVGYRVFRRQSDRFVEEI